MNLGEGDVCFFILIPLLPIESNVAQANVRNGGTEDLYLTLTAALSGQPYAEFCAALWLSLAVDLDAAPMQIDDLSGNCQA